MTVETLYSYDLFNELSVLVSLPEDPVTWRTRNLVDAPAVDPVPNSHDTDVLSRSVTSIVYSLTSLLVPMSSWTSVEFGKLLITGACPIINSMCLYSLDENSYKTQKRNVPLQVISSQTLMGSNVLHISVENEYWAYQKTTRSDELIVY